MNSNEIYKELKKEQTKLEYQTKKVLKLKKMYSSKFSDEQRLLSKTCPEGEVTKALRVCIVNYVRIQLLLSFVLEAVTVERILSERPPHSTLLKYLDNKSIYCSLAYGTTRRYYNKFFAKQWIKDNIKSIAEEVLNEKIN